MSRHTKTGTTTYRMHTVYVPRRHSKQLIRRRRRTALALLLLTALVIGMWWPFFWVHG